MKKNSFLVLSGTLLTLLIASCTKNQTDKGLNQSTNPSAAGVHGTGAKLDRQLYLNTRHANLDSIKESMLNSGLLSKLQVNGPLPTSIILNHPAIGDQGATGTCVSWSVGHALMGTLDNEFPVAGVSNPRSGWYVYQKDHSNSGDCDPDDGMYTTNGLSILTNNGVPADSVDNYLGSPCSAPSSTVNANAATNRSISYYAISSVTDIKTALSMHLPVEMAFNVYTSFDDAFNYGTTYTSVYGTYRGGHAVVIIGYDDTKNAFLIQNSWGAWGGDASYPGCVWIDYGLFSSSALAIELYVATPQDHDLIPGSYSGTNFNYVTTDPSINSVAMSPSDTQPLLTVGASIYSVNNSCRLTLQTDGNLVLYRENSGGGETGVWSSRTQGHTAGALYFQTDGNLVLYAPGSSPNGTHSSLWASMRYNNAGLGTVRFAKYYLQNDVNLVMYWPVYYGNSLVYVVFAATDTGGGITSSHGGNLNPVLWSPAFNMAPGGYFY